MEQKTKKWLVAGVLTVAVAIGVGTCYSNTSDKSSSKKEAVKNTEKTEEKQTSKNTKSAEKEEASYYPLTIKTQGPDGKEYETVYEKQPEKVVAVYQGNVETMLALGLEDKIAAVAGIEQPVLEEYQEAFSKLKNLEEFTPSKETITA
ncbi:MAG: iron ABC transporter substrate-binding protein, partial [Blautia sp.]|nr:iron ABC transporter substrate-binding protein [Blautia sp.]